MTNYISKALIALALATGAVSAVHAQAPSKPVQNSKSEENTTTSTKAPVVQAKPGEKFGKRDGYISAPMPLPDAKTAPKLPTKITPEDLKGPSLTPVVLPKAVSINVELLPLVKGERELTIELPDYTGERLRQENLGLRVLFSKTPMRISGTELPDDIMVMTAYNKRPRQSLARVSVILPQFDDEEMQEFETYVSTGKPGGARGRKYAKAGIRDNLVSFVGGETVYYRVELAPKDGGPSTHSNEQSFVMPHPIVLAVIGDSFAAGEGAPETPSSDYRTAGWSVPVAHNSSRSGGTFAIRHFKAKNPKLWVVGRNFAITGATLQEQTEDIAGGILGDYEKDREIMLKTPRIEAESVQVTILGRTFNIPKFSLTEKKIGAQREKAKFKGQIEEAELWLAENQYDGVDALFLSVGGNDAGFGDIIVNSLLGVLPVTDFFDLTELQVEAQLDAAEEFVPLLRSSLQQSLRPNEVFWFNYPNLTRDQDSVHSELVFQDTDNVLLGLFQSRVTPRDLASAESTLINVINPRIASWCAMLQNCEVLDVQDRADGHGIGTRRLEDRWFNTFVDSHDDVQGSLDGAIHPNAAGYANIYQPVALAKLTELFDQRTGTHFEDVRQARQTAKDQRQLLEQFSRIKPTLVSADLRGVTRRKQQRDQQVRQIASRAPQRTQSVAAKMAVITKEQKAQLLVLYADDPEKLAKVESLQVK